jgi:hypothetical protein
MGMGATTETPEAAAPAGPVPSFVDGTVHTLSPFATRGDEATRDLYDTVAPSRLLVIQGATVLPMRGAKALPAHDVLVRVRAAGICHSDVHYRAGRSRVEPLPLTLGHEVAGDVVAVGDGVHTHAVGDRVCLHYLVICGQCPHCVAGREQFCPTGLMLGHFTDGGWAEYIAVPARNAVRLPATVPYEHGAVMMCSSSTSLHALRKARCLPGDTVLVVGAGGLGMSAIQIAQQLGATRVIAADRDPTKLALAQRLAAQESEEEEEETEDSPLEENTTILNKAPSADFTPSKESKIDKSPEQIPQLQERIVLNSPNQGKNLFVSKEEKIRIAALYSFTLVTIVLLVLVAMRKL